MIVSAFFCCASPSRNSSLRVLLPPVASPVQSSRLIKSFGPPRSLLKFSSGSSGVGKWANGDYVGPGYGLATDGMIEAIELLAREEGILLDPVYSGKGMAGLIDLVRKGEFRKDENIVFLHTGGSAGLFAYRKTFTA